GRPPAACYNSFRTPVQEQIDRLAAAVPAPHALDALSALGFRTIFLHRDFLSGRRAMSLPPALASAAAAPGARLAALGSAGQIDAYGLPPPRALQEEFASLVPARKPPDPLDVSSRVAALRFVLENRDAATFLHPEPLLPSDLVVRWMTA